ncbi:VOC family protein [Nocardioides panacihumi]|uniref:VOC family protein n=1 Tax=Nocardioides panacihumi TaxID=400774 RepID=A0ABP5CV99_9ACTN
MVSRLSVITIHAVAPERVARFWCDALGWQVLERDGEVVSIGLEDATGPTIDVVTVPEPKQVKNRLHFDLRADGVSTRTELERLQALGARPVDVGQSADASWVVLADVEGNEFCLLSRTQQELGPPN